MVNGNRTIQDLVELWKFFRWLDNARWGWERKRKHFIKKLLNYTNEAWQKCGFEKIKQFEPEHLVLSHWLTYIFDYQISANKVWKECFPIMARIVWEFQKGLSPKKIMEKYRRTDSKTGETYFCMEKWEFRHRFMNAGKLSKKIERTLKVLENYNRDLIEFMVRISERKANINTVQKLACSLYLLTYDNLKEKDMSVDEEAQRIVRIIENENEFRKYCENKWKDKRGNEKRKIWHKRLWSALRDYLKSSIAKEIKERIEKKYGNEPKIMELWKSPEKYLIELELPGDTWNQKFYKNVILPLVRNIGIKVKGESSSKDIREIYEWLCEKYFESFNPHELYPEQFDVTFDFTRIFCNNELCYICPLYKNGKEIEKLCIKDVIQERNKKFCPLLAILGYLQVCDPTKCSINLKDLPKICDGQSDV